MPCDQQRTTVVDIAKLDLPLLPGALQALGYKTILNGEEVIFWKEGSPRHRYADGKITFSGNVAETMREEWTGKIKQAYSGEVVKATAARFGWELKKNPLKEFTYTATRRG